MRWYGDVFEICSIFTDQFCCKFTADCSSEIIVKIGRYLMNV